jgi:hypothetical protein
VGLPYSQTINFEDWIDVSIPQPPKDEDPLMSYSIVPVENGAIFLVSLITGKRVHIIQPRDVDLLLRVKNNVNNDHMLTIELDIVDAYLNELHKLAL